MNTYYIKLNEMRFYAYHGVYEIEKTVGQWFEVNTELSFYKEKIEGLNDTINYEVIYNIIKLEMQTPHELLETFLQTVTHKITTEIKQLNTLKISIKKLNPLMGKEVGSSEVVLERVFG